MAQSSTPHRGDFVAYYRVSTDRQGESGLGLDAQRKAVRDFLDGGSWELIREFTEVESGKRSDNRPELTAALDLCRKRRATLVIAKLDRLSRNVAFIATLLDSNVRFKCADMPEADRTFLQMVAVFAEYERRRISQRTKDALAAAKARGVTLGNPRLAEVRDKANAASMAAADAFAANVLPIIREIQASGVQSFRGIAHALTARGIKTARGGTWTPVQVSDILRR
jgi:DNA invertase Pin-like site-specific DNA recombinase